MQLDVQTANGYKVAIRMPKQKPKLSEISQKSRAGRNGTGMHNNGFASALAINGTILHENSVPYKTAHSATPADFRFIDLFCGIGGFRLASQRADGKCVFSCDCDKHSQVTYEANFGEKPWWDIHTKAVAIIH